MNIVVNNLTKSFENKIVLESFNYTFQKGKTYCLMGESGIGKTTLLNLLMGLIKPDSGEISGVPQNVSAVFQEDRLCEPFSALANVKAVTGKTVSDGEILSLLADLGLNDSANCPVSTLSGGMRRRVAIARALLAKSDLLILDEPFKGLDDETRENTARVILSRAKNKTLIIATHDVRDPSLLSAEVVSL